jgi:hypothetical protein
MVPIQVGAITKDLFKNKRMETTSCDGSLSSLHFASTLTAVYGESYIIERQMPPSSA